MDFRTLRIVLISLFFLATPLIANISTTSDIKSMDGKKLLLAKAKSKKKRSKSRKVKEKHIVREKTYKGEKKNLDFDAIDISGERKTPFGSIINQNKASKDFDLIKIRLRWHPEMIQSTSSLETGRSR